MYVRIPAERLLSCSRESLVSTKYCVPNKLISKFLHTSDTRLKRKLSTLFCVRRKQQLTTSVEETSHETDKHFKFIFMLLFCIHNFLNGFCASQKGCPSPSYIWKDIYFFAKRTVEQSLPRHTVGLGHTVPLASERGRVGGVSGCINSTRAGDNARCSLSFIRITISFEKG